MRLEKISLNQLKKDLRKLYTKKKRSRFGESSPPGLTEEQIKTQKRDNLRRKFKDAAKIAGAIALGGLAVAGTVKGAKEVAKTKAYQTVKGAVTSRVNDETDKAKQNVQTAIQHAQSVVHSSEQNLQKSANALRNAANASKQRTVEDLSNAAQNMTGTVVKHGGDALVNAIKIKQNATANINNAMSEGVKNLAAFIAPTQTGK